MRHIENPYLRCDDCGITEAELGGPGDIKIVSTPEGNKWLCDWCEEDAITGKNNVWYDPDPSKML